MYFLSSVAQLDDTQIFSSEQTPCALKLWFHYLSVYMNCFAEMIGVRKLLEGLK